MGVGFLPGRPSTSRPGEYVVTGRLAHTWPELYFEDAGWVRFEPTPAAQTGAPPVYADPLAGVPVRPDEQIPTGAPTQQPSTPGATSPGGGAPGGDVALGRARVPLVAVVGVALALVVASVLVGRRRWPSAGEEELDPELAWERLRRRLREHDVTWGGSATPRTAGATIREALGEDAPERAVAGLAELVRSLEDSRYAPVPRAWSPQELEHWVESVVEGFTRVEEPVPA
jgi:hypothetical protein